MSPEQLSVEPHEKTGPTPEMGRVPDGSPRHAGWGRVVVGLVVAVLATALIGGVYLVASGKAGQVKRGAREHSEGGSLSGTGEPRVQVVKPVRGGMERTTNQPGTIRAFEYALLYAKVSGFVKTLHVDRGSQVKKGELLAEIYDPERDVAVDQALAALEHAKATVAQARSSILTAEASVLAAKAMQKEAKATLEAKRSYRDYSQKEFARIKSVVKLGDVEERLADEMQDQYLAAQGAVLAADAGIETAAANLGTAIAKVALAKADLKAAEAGVKVAEANLELARVFVQYTRILSPYDGVVIFRGDAVHPGSFIRSAAEGVGEPLLTVARVDKMRTVVLVPDPDVPYCKVGDPATVTLDALAGKVFHGHVSRIAESEDLNDRTMRVEIDLDNPDRTLRDGMFGRAKILLEKLIKNLTIPSSCLIERNGKGDGAVLVVRDGEVHRVDLHLGIDSGVRVEVTSGLKDDDQVILQPDSSIADGTKVQAEIASPQAAS
jgi:HlyD family secretion protein